MSNTRRSKQAVPLPIPSMASVPGFLSKTFEIFSTPEYADCCGWGQEGKTIVIRKIEQFSKNVLPKYFKHANFQSFVRQLNMYDFRKTVQDPSNGEFRHEHFQQNRPDLLAFIKRKANNRKGIESMQGGAHDLPHASSAHSAGGQHAMTLSGGDQGIVQEYDLDLQDGSYYSPYAVQQVDPQNDMEYRIHKIENENAQLKHLFLESQQKNHRMQEKLEKVLHTLYQVFKGHPQLNAFQAALPAALPASGAGGGYGLLMDEPYVETSSMPSFARLHSLDSAPYGISSPMQSSIPAMPFAHPSNGMELTSSTRSTSFDTAAASVCAPPIYSDRVTLLPDEDTRKRTASSSDDLPAKIPRTSSSSSPTPSPTPTPDLDYLLLNRNQSTALHRLDSLEQTIATLLDHMERTDSVDVLDDNEVIVEGQGERQADSSTNERIVP